MNIILCANRNNIVFTSSSPELHGDSISEEVPQTELKLNVCHCGKRLFKSVLYKSLKPAKPHGAGGALLEQNNE